MTLPDVYTGGLTENDAEGQCCSICSALHGLKRHRFEPLLLNTAFQEIFIVEITSVNKV